MNIDATKPVIFEWVSSSIMPTLESATMRGALAAGMAIANASGVSVRALLVKLFPVAEALGLWNGAGDLNTQALAAGIIAYFGQAAELPVPIGSGRHYNINKTDAEKLLAMLVRAEGAQAVSAAGKAPPEQ